MASNPLEAYQQEKLGAKEKQKKHELELWQKWKDNGEQAEHLEPLLKLYEPIIQQKMRLWKPKAVPESAFRAELQTHAIKAFQNFDPSRGVALNTHVESRLPKALRYGNKGANMAYLPEGQVKHIGAINKAKDTLRDELGRDPTVEELGDHLGMPPKRIETIMKGMRRDVPMGRSTGEDYDYSGGSEGNEHGFEDQQIAVAQHILPDIFPGKSDMHELFHYTFGTGGYPKVSSTGVLAKKMGKTPQQISHMKSAMGRTLRKYMNPEVEED